MPTVTKAYSSHAAESAPAPRDRILATARDLFYRLGINSVGVEAIASAASTNKMTLYRHFKSKDDLIVAYVSELAAEGDAFWNEITEKFPNDPQKRINAWLDHVENVLANRFERGCALANAAVELQPGHAARAIIEAYKKRKSKHLVALFASARYKDPERLADEVFLLFEGARISLQCGGKGPALRTTRMLRELVASAPRHRGGR